jgi:hypothetical protein
LEENVLRENLMLPDLAPHYIGALTNDFFLRSCYTIFQID